MNTTIQRCSGEVKQTPYCFLLSAHNLASTCTTFLKRTCLPTQHVVALVEKVNDKKQK